jgi:tetratricopeptide (TPR) repeat protein
MKKSLFIVAGALLLTMLLTLPAPLLCKDKAQRKDMGYNPAYISVEEATKTAKFKDDVKQKVDAVLSGALETIPEPERAEAEGYGIGDSVLNQYDSQTEYNYEPDKEYKGDENDQDLESMPPGQLKKLLDNLDKVRDSGWGWYWTPSNKGKRSDKHGSWTIHKINKKIAWKHYRKALEYHAAGNYQMAKKELLIALWFWPTFVEAHTQLGIENICLNLLTEAETNFKRALKIDPNFGKAYYGLSILYMMKVPPQVFDSVECVQYARELGYSGEQDYFDFVMLVANLPMDTTTGTATTPPAESPERSVPGYGYGDKNKEHTGATGQGH